MKIEFNKYQHIERLGTIETEGILNGVCYIFPKIDGTNGQIWWNDGLQAGSRNRHLTIDKDNARFLAWALEQIMFNKLFSKYPTLKLYGEWLVPHTLKTYESSAWRKFYVFDVVNIESEDYYLPYDEYKLILDEFDIEYIPPICCIGNPTYEFIIGLLDKNTYLIQDGKGSGEGVVIKNYEYRNKFGRQTWAKIVKNEFKTKHSKLDVIELKDKLQIEEVIVEKYITSTFIKKEMSKIILENDGWHSKLIPRLLNTIYYCLIKEESWNFIKENKNPTIDFKKLLRFTTNKIKELSPELF